MKAEFKNISNIQSGQVFFLYGNYKDSFDVFCNYVVEKLNQITSENVKTVSCSLSDYEQFQELTQYSLFEDAITCFFIRKIEDKNLASIQNLHRENSVFILESGDYLKSKKICEFLVKDKETVAIASFNNDMTLMSLCQMLFPQLSAIEYRELIKIITETDENLVSLFQKISLLLEDGDFRDLTKTYKKSALNDMEFVSLIRYALQAALKENILHRSQSYTNLKLQDKIHFLLEAERKQKLNNQLSKTYLLQLLLNF